MSDRDGDEEQVDIDDPDVSASPSVGPMPPPLPPMSSQAPLTAGSPIVGSVAPARKPVPYGLLIAAILLVGIGAAVGVAFVVRRGEPAAASEATPAPKVFTVPTVELADEPDSGPASE